MKSRLFGYDKNQIRVYFISLQAGHQRQLDQWEEKINKLQTSLDQTISNLEQLKMDLVTCTERIEKIEQVGERVEVIKMRLLDRAQANANRIINEAVTRSAQLSQTKSQTDKGIRQCHHMFINLIKSCKQEWVDLMGQREAVTNQELAKYL